MKEAERITNYIYEAYGNDESRCLFGVLDYMPESRRVVETIVQITMDEIRSKNEG